MVTITPVIEKYLDMQAPRYTSYPTAPHFTPAVGVRQTRRWLEEIPARSPVSLYLHIPFCKKMCWYCGCNMQIANRYDSVTDYVDCLIAEIRQAARLLPSDIQIEHIHWGGGTPNTLSFDDFIRVSDVIRRCFPVASECEIAIEVDPRTAAQDLPALFKDIGCTRVSIGVQEFDERVQKAINRIQPLAMVSSLVERFRDHGISAVNFDLLYGLPRQTTEGLLRTIDAAVALEPSRIALFGYAHVPWIAKNQRMIDGDGLPSSAQRYAMAEAAAVSLSMRGYQRVGIDHFAQASDPLSRAASEGRLHRNFQGYTTDTTDILIGLGASAISSFPQGYSQNATKTNDYANAVRENGLATAKGIAISAEDRLRREIIMRLMCFEEVDLSQFQAFEPLACAELNRRLERFAEDGLVMWDAPHLKLTESGKPLARVVAASFDAYLGQNLQRHAKVS